MARQITHEFKHSAASARQREKFGSPGLADIEVGLDVDVDGVEGEDAARTRNTDSHRTTMKMPKYWVRRKEIRGSNSGVLSMGNRTAGGRC